VRFCDIVHVAMAVMVVSVPGTLKGIVVATTIFDLARGMFLRDEPTAAAGPAKPVAKKMTQTFHAVSIQAGRNCCRAARELQGHRFLSREAPSLPLKDCSSDNCMCHYQHHDDRRRGPRRARDMGVAMDGWLEVDQRVQKGRGRRKSDNPG
jgi:hypothetical protein